MFSVLSVELHCEVDQSNTLESSSDSSLPDTDLQDWIGFLILQF